MIDHNQHLPNGFLPTADQVVVSMDGHPLRVVRYSQFDTPIYFVHASPGEGLHRVSVVIKRKNHTARLHPRRLGIALEKEKRSLVFTFEGHPHFVLESEALGCLLFAFDPPQPDPSGPGVLDSAALGIVPGTGETQTAALQAAMDRISSDDALHTLRIAPGLYRTGDLHLRSDCRLHLSSGAVLQASDHADAFGGPGLADPDRPGLINAKDAKDFSVTGHGHIDGNRPVLDLDGYYGGMVRLTSCRNILLDGPVFSDSCGWNTTLRHCTDVVCHRLKILNNRPTLDCINTDGINPVSSSRVQIAHCLMHTGDDAVAVKSLPTGDLPAADVADITVTDLLAINNSSTAKIGTETMASVMERIRFERIDAVRTWRLIVIEAFDHAHVREVTFTDCHAHLLDGTWYPAHLIQLSAPAPRDAFRPIAGLGRIDGVTLTRISSDSAGRCAITGQSAERGVQNITLEDIRVAGEKIPADQLELGTFVSNVRYSHPSQPDK